MNRNLSPIWRGLVPLSLLPQSSFKPLQINRASLSPGWQLIALSFDRSILTCAVLSARKHVIIQRLLFVSPTHLRVSVLLGYHENGRLKSTCRRRGSPHACSSTHFHVTSSWPLVNQLTICLWMTSASDLFLFCLFSIEELCGACLLF